MPPLQIQRIATVYRLWDDDELRQCFSDHAAVGWACTLVCFNDGQEKWEIRLQHNEQKQLLSGDLDGVVVSDMVTVEVMSLMAYNLAHPDNVIGEGS
jgi:hypothetical protein